MSTLSSSTSSRRLAHVRLAVGAALGDHRLDLGVLPRVQRLEREVLELPLHLVNAEPVRERCIDLERLLRLLHLLLLARYSIARMLCSRSASLIRMTRTSSAIATTIFR
jgi:hypothetical protein